MRFIFGWWRWHTGVSPDGGALPTAGFIAGFGSLRGYYACIVGIADPRKSPRADKTLGPIAV